MSLYKEATTKIKVGSGYSDEFPVKVGAHQEFVLSPFLFASVIDVATENVRKRLFYELLQADDLLFISNSVESI